MPVLGAPVLGPQFSGKPRFDQYSPANGTLMDHYDNTLAKVNVQQICDLNQVVRDKLEEYSTAREEGPEKKAIIAKTITALVAARVTQLEMVIMKLAKKSSRPKVRIESQIATFETENMFGDGTRFEAKANLGAPVIEWLAAVHSVHIGVGKPDTAGGVAQA